MSRNATCGFIKTWLHKSLKNSQFECREVQHFTRMCRISTTLNCSFDLEILIRRESCSLTDFLFLFSTPKKLNKQTFFSYLYKLDKQTDLKWQHSFTLFYFVCGGPCHLSSFKQCTRDLREQLVCSVMEKINISFVLLPYWYCKY